MKVFSLLSTAVITTVMTTSGFCDDARISQSENTSIDAVISHSNYGNGSNGSNYSNQNQSYSGSYQNSGSPSDRHTDPNAVEHSVHGCMNGGFSLQGEFIWWRAQMDNLQYAIQSNATPSAASPFTPNGRVKDPDFEFDPGVRISAGYDFGSSNWDVFLRWTWQYTDVSDSTGSTGLSRAVTPLKDFTNNQGTLTVSVADTGRGKWENTMNVLDFEMGYDYFLSDRCSLRPFFGVKAAWFDMDYRATYGNVTSNQGGVLPEVDVKSDMDYWGVGPQVGMDGYLHIGWGFSLYGQTSAALIYGNYDSDFRQTDSSGDSFTVKYDSYARQRAVAIIGIGVEWAYCFSGNYLLALNLGWEGQYWWNQYQLIYAQDISFHGDLTYTGLNAGLRFDF